MTDTPKIREIDLMAYADGLLEGDAARKAAVEAHLAANQADAARVHAIMCDNAAIRALYAAELERPTPAHLLRAVREPRRRKRYFSAEAIAAGLALAFLAAGGGWLVG
ncbi:anti-sigma factor family protein, partial [Nitratireductor sp. GCM10026969]|uniref:anti-sigma factor family protein n=1 Tax=Nitratireductor sp. GCM10026969 TaxID=3252645 RepID=UPI00361D9ECF